MKYIVILHHENDLDILVFLNTITHGKWSSTVEKIMRASVNNKVARIPMSFILKPMRSKNTHFDVST